ncbi:carboxylesterase family protein [Nocardia sp. NBC_01499]|uniref:carboxylesterase/lipase family protein n=1 Tax=Nocardia sp. NBC_01499 TaxID=2903597 RepID=UPI0038709428
MSDPIVTTTEGAVRGHVTDTAHVFLDIPYAAPPLGPARFDVSTPHQPWSGVRDATRPGPTAPQPGRDFGKLDMSPYFGPGWVHGADYLTVSVWAPAQASNSPVMVFVHGGGYVSGSNRAPLYDGKAFARDGVVLVTVNYRIGIPGFLDLPGAPANRGMLDIVAALRWVRRNVAAFGGDPDNVTLFGQSAGATIVGGLLALPEGRNLFHRAIVQSGSGTGAFSPEQAARVTRAAADTLGIKPTATDFAEIPDERLVALVPELTGIDLRTETSADPLAGLSPFGLVLDTQPADAVAAGASAEVTLIVGTNTEEANLYLAPQHDSAATSEDAVYATAAGVDTDPKARVARYRARHPQASLTELQSTLLGDALFGTGSRRLAEAHAALGASPTYTYEFDWQSTALDGRLGAAHTVELPFVFDRLDLPPLHGSRGLLGPAEPPKALAARMHGAWVRFAHTGDPGWTPSHAHRFTGQE